MLQSRLAMGVLTSTLLLVSVIAGSSSFRETCSESHQLQAEGQRKLDDTPLRLWRIGDSVLTLLPSDGWVLGTSLLDPTDERYQHGAVTDSGLTHPFHETAEPDFGDWNDWRSKDCHSKLIALLGSHGSVDPDIQLTFRELAQVFPKAQGKLDVLAAPWGPWILQ